MKFSPALENLIDALRDRKSTRLNSSHDQILYAVFCLKKKIRSDNLLDRYQYRHPLDRKHLAERVTGENDTDNQVHVANETRFTHDLAVEAVLHINVDTCNPRGHGIVDTIQAS